MMVLCFVLNLLFDLVIVFDGYIYCFWMVFLFYDFIGFFVDFFYEVDIVNDCCEIWIGSFIWFRIWIVRIGVVFFVEVLKVDLRSVVRV